VTRTRIKFCGMTRAEDVDAAVALGADAIGLVLVPGSPRHLDVEAAAALRRRLSPFVSAVLLLRDAEAAFVHAAVARIRPDLLQFHGGETGAYCTQFGRPYLAAVAMGHADDAGGSGADAAARAAEHPHAVGILLDSHVPGGMGGQGRPFDWTRIPARFDRPLILAGGLDPGNVGAAVATVRPYAVDVSSGIEASPGIKDCAKMQAFIDGVRRGECG
jgi:phosphoribosylanthranilate isomerase